ncbi:thyroid transcription factor 1-associated protein 26 [Lissotriton helveticus]
MAPVNATGKRLRDGPASHGRGPVQKHKMKSKRRWMPPEARKKFEGSTNEGQGFAFRRKQKIQQQYKRLKQKEKNINPAQEMLYTENYPEHLKHLYLAEEEMLKKQKMKSKEGQEKDSQTFPGPKSNTVAESSTTKQTKSKKKTSNLKAKEEYERIQVDRAKKKEEALKRKQEKEEAQRLYKQRKMEAYKILSKKTKKGQPNLNLQMEYLLQKIQQNN